MGWNWITSRVAFGFLSWAEVAGERDALPWQYVGAAMEETGGRKLTLRFARDEPAVEIVSQWHARPGPGPVHHSMQIRNHSTESVTIGEQPTFDLDLTGASAMWSFQPDGRTPDPVGVYRHALKAAGAGRRYSVRTAPTGEFIPYVVFGANQGHGVDVGLEWSFCRISNRLTSGAGCVILALAEETPAVAQQQIQTRFVRKAMSNQKTTLSRRTFLGSTAALAASSMMPHRALGASAAKPNSNFNGVQIGVITYSYRSLPGGAEDLLKYITDCGISSIELMGGPAEQFAGAPAAKRGGSQALLDWRLSVSMDRFEALRKMYNDAGVKIHIVKFGDIGNPGMPDEQIEYYFRAAKALGARGITRELSETAAARLGPIADKHEIVIGFHNHTQLTPTAYDGEILSYGKYLGINLDIGHYVAGTNHSPIPLIEKHHDRILSLHLKDRKINKGPNMPFGQGDTPVALVLQYMKRRKLTFPGDIELEYRVPQGSDAVQEVKKCVAFCRQALE